MPHGRQVGITARNVAPRLYLAVGVGGSSNHLAGVSRAHTVLAINVDPAAVIFDAADIGIVGEWSQAVPALAAELSARGLGMPRVPEAASI
jgi:electron transfer flavoprotein alpha subunit